MSRGMQISSDSTADYRIIIIVVYRRLIVRTNNNKFMNDYAHRVITAPVAN